MKENEIDTEEKLLELYIEELKAVPPVEEFLRKEWMQKASNGDQEARKRLAESYLLQTLHLAAKYRGQGVGLADLIQEANVGLMEAIDKETVTEVNILTSVEEALKRVVEKETKIGEQLADRLNMLSDTAKELAKRYGKEPTIEELADYLHITVEEVQSDMKLSLDVLSVKNS